MAYGPRQDCRWRENARWYLVFAAPSLEIALHASEMGEQPVACAPKKLDRLRFTQPERTNSRNAFANFCDQRTAGHRNHDIVRKAPIHAALGDFVAVRFRAFGYIWRRLTLDGPLKPSAICAQRRLTWS